MKTFITAVATISLLAANTANADWVFSGEQAISEPENGIQFVLMCDVDGHPTFRIEGHHPERPTRETFYIALGDLGAAPFLH